MECVAVKYILDFELERPTSAKSLGIQIKAKLFTALPMIATTKHLRSASINDLTSGSHNIRFVCFGCIFC